MSKLLAGTRYLILIGVLALLVTALAAFGWGLVKTLDAVRAVLSPGDDAALVVALIEVVDIFLVATATLIFSYSLYELFIGDLALPGWMQVHDLHDLKAKLGGILILVMAVKFLEKVVDWKNGQETLYFALAIAVVAAVLIAFSYFGNKD
jgi:uncharacterized membrane protein YqhA